MADDDNQCPAATGIPEQTLHCIINGKEHHCMRDPTTHPLHTCHCGTHWVSSTDAAHQLTQGGPHGPTIGMHWRSPNGSLWIAPLGAPPPNHPMPAQWLCIRPRTR